MASYALNMQLCDRPVFDAPSNTPKRGLYPHDGGKPLSAHRTPAVKLR
eukprot:CAMPEP_0203910410 /NCGR_PEP_ID=MMETSP0359-20131031/51647_1 /ASSEMBLY_ACC=CAM_ASM_000338 /TAXON_ID=268821 /ORGANISM="Scrippsiella Hangoei, Strain SHTV-5" /LENGTH=47 /DNA_ID= /DNA_START= /DNA_END= /DNA_ORIENTATION=